MRLIHGTSRFRPYTSASGGWGSAHSVLNILWREQAFVKGSAALIKQNKPKGFACVSCAWAKPGDPHALEFCENGAKATAWELTSLRTAPSFFQAHTVTELRGWQDYDLEQYGRLTHPMRYDAQSDRYVTTTWEEAASAIGAQLRALSPDEVVFYASGRASLETSFMYQLFARAYGTNNLPDSSNMCHESTSVGLQESIGVPVGTVTLADFEHTDCIFFFGQNVGSNSPRMLHPLQEARKRKVPIITFNPIRERGLERFVNPQSPVEMLGPKSTVISTQYHQVAIGGDTAAVMGVADDRFRGVKGTRKVVFLNRNDIVRLGYAPGDWVRLRTAIEPAVGREVGPFQIIAYDIPEGCAASYYPESNALIPLWHYAKRSKVPAAKSVPIILIRAQPDAYDLDRAVPETDQVV